MERDELNMEKRIYDFEEFHNSLKSNCIIPETRETSIDTLNPINLSKHGNKQNRKSVVNPYKYYEGDKFMPALLEQEILSVYMIIYINGLGFFMFNDAYWQNVTDTNIKKLCKDRLGYKAKSCDINNTVELIRLEAEIPISQLNQNKNRLVLKNGTLDLTDWLNPKFYEHQYFSEDYCTIQLNIDYNPKAEAKIFEQFLNSTFEGDTERANVICEILGYCLTPTTKFEKAFLFYGEGSNGKSVLLNVFEKLLTSINVASVSLSDLDKPFSRSSLLNKLLNISSEQEGAIKDTGYFKKIVTGDLIDAQYKFKDSFEFRPICKMVFAMNHLPKAKDRSHGYYRRFIMIPFNKVFTEQEQDKNLTQKLEQELDGILQYALQGLKRLAEQNGFTKSVEAERLLTEYKAEGNPIEQFFNEHLVENDTEMVSTKRLYSEYKNYCVENGYKGILNSSNFAKELLKMFPKVRKERLSAEGGRDYYYTGIEMSY
jgi:putative DNA primase/helicase